MAATAQQTKKGRKVFVVGVGMTRFRKPLKKFTKACCRGWANAWRGILMCLGLPGVCGHVGR